LRMMERWRKVVSHRATPREQRLICWSIDVEVGDGAVVGEIHLVFEREDFDFVFVLADFVFDDLELDIELAVLIGVEALRLDDFIHAKQLDVEVFELAAHEPHERGDAGLLFHIAVRLVIGDANGGVAHLALAAQGHRVNGNLARAGEQARLLRVDHLEIVASERRINARAPSWAERELIMLTTERWMRVVGPLGLRSVKVGASTASSLNSKTRASAGFATPLRATKPAS